MVASGGRRGAGWAFATLLVAACVATPPPTPIPAVTAPVPSAASSDRSGPPTAAPPVVAPSVMPAGPIASRGVIALLGNDGSLWLVDASGRVVPLASNVDGLHQFPAWSPDGTRVAAIQFGPTGTNQIRVFDAQAALAGQAQPPLLLFESSTVAPIYLAWLPDGASLSFLASDDSGLTLRIAPVDGGTSEGEVLRAGDPFYFDWIAPDRVFAHVGAGPEALLVELALDGAATTPAVPGPGEFRSADVSDDGALVGYVRVAGGGASEVVIAARDGGAEHALPVFGPTAVGFDPAGHTLAMIGAVRPLTTDLQVPLGPLRLLDGDSGEDRLALDGNVLGFWWSPDGSMLAALRVQPVDRPVPPASSASPDPATTEARLLFVDATSGEVRSEYVVQPGQLFIRQVLSYFDQYARSHRLWAPDGSSVLLPVVGDDGRNRVAVMSASGGAPILIAGVVGFWSP